MNRVYIARRWISLCPFRPRRLSGSSLRSFWGKEPCRSGSSFCFFRGGSFEEQSAVVVVVSSSIVAHREVSRSSEKYTYIPGWSGTSVRRTRSLFCSACQSRHPILNPNIIFAFSTSAMSASTQLTIAAPRTPTAQRSQSVFPSPSDCPGPRTPIKALGTPGRSKFGLARSEIGVSLLAPIEGCSSWLTFIGSACN
jgi:hypothetical protein